MAGALDRLSLRRALLSLPASNRFNPKTPMQRMMQAAHRLADARDLRAPWDPGPAIDHAQVFGELASEAMVLYELREESDSEKDPLYKALAPLQKFASWYGDGTDATVELLEARLRTLRTELRKDKRKGHREERKAEMLEKFDADGDGKLSREERAAARDAGYGRKGPRKDGPPPAE